MSIKGSSIVWLERAIERGDLLTAWTTAHVLPSLPLDHALGLVVLVAADPDRSSQFDAAAVRWVLRLAASRPAPTLDELRDVVGALAGLPDLVAVTGLGELCQRRRWRTAAAALDHLTPTAGAPAAMPGRRGERRWG